MKWCPCLCSRSNEGAHSSDVTLELPKADIMARDYTFEKPSLEKKLTFNTSGFEAGWSVPRDATEQQAARLAGGTSARPEHVCMRVQHDHGRFSVNIELKGTLRDLQLKAERRKQVEAMNARRQRPGRSDETPACNVEDHSVSTAVKPTPEAGAPASPQPAANLERLFAAVESGDAAAVAELGWAIDDFDHQLTHPRFGSQPVTPLMLAVQIPGRAAVVRALLKCGADPNRPPVGMPPPLTLAALGGDAQVVDALLRNGAEVDAIDARGGTALVAAAFAGNASICLALCLHGCQVNMQASDGGHALVGASRQGHVPTIRVLIENGADVDLAGDLRKASPIMLAAAGLHVDAVEELIHAGADADLLDSNGETAQQYADKTLARRKKRKELSEEAAESLRQKIVAALACGDAVGAALVRERSDTGFDDVSKAAPLSADTVRVRCDTGGASCPVSSRKSRSCTASRSLSTSGMTATAGMISRVSTSGKLVGKV